MNKDTKIEAFNCFHGEITCLTQQTLWVIQSDSPVL